MNRIAELRKNKNLSQQQLAEIFDVAQNTLCNWELGIREPKISTYCKIAEYFDVPVDYVIGIREQGHWIFSTYRDNEGYLHDIFRCSNCHVEFDEDKIDDNTKYCPHCGCRIDGFSNENDKR